LKKLSFIILLLLSLDCLSQDVWMTPNRGQWDERILYNVDLNQGKLYLENTQMTFYLSDALSHNHGEHEHHSEEKKGISYHVIKKTFLNANIKSSRIETNSSAHYSNFILGSDPAKWKSEVYSFEEVEYEQFYPNIDLVYNSRKGQLAYNFTVLPQGNPSLIQFVLTGAESVKLSSEGSLIMKHRFGEIIESAPIAWTEDENGKRSEVACLFQLQNDTVRFQFPNGYNANQRLIIDPSLTFSTFTGSTADNWGFTATPDINGNLFGGGIVFGSGYPLSTGAYDVSYNSGTGTFPMDVGITKYNTTGTSILYSTYLGGSGNETPHSIVSAQNGELYIYGVTSSTNFPMAGAPYDNTHNGGPYEIENSLEFNGADIYVARLNANGTALLSSTYVGGTNTDGLNTNNLHYNYGDQFRGEIILDDNQNVYISSTTASSNFPTVSASQSTLNGGQDAVIFRLNSSLSALTWSTFFGGSGLETGNSVTISSNGFVYAAGGTSSLSLPLSAGNDLSFNGGISDGYVLRLNQSNGQFVSGTYMGMNEYDQTYFVDTDIDNFVYVYGQTESDWGVSPGCYGTPNSGQFVRKYSADLQTIAWSTMIGAAHGHVEISPTAFLVSDCYDIYLAGWGGILNQNDQATFSTSSSFQCTPDGYQLTTNGNNFYIAVLDQNASALKYATFMGGTNSSYNHVDGGTSRFDKSGRIYHAVCGACGGNDYGFTSTPGSWSPTNNSSNCNMATFKFELSTIQAAAAQPAPLICIPQSVYFQNNSTNGNAYLWDFGDGNSSTEFEPIYQYTEPGIYDVTLVVYDTNGCFSSDSVTITVAIGAFEGGVVQPSSPICPGDSYQFDAFGGVNYSWTPANLLNNPNISNPVATITTTTTFSVVISDSCGSVTVPVTLEVFQSSLSVSPDTSICIGGSVPLDAETNGTVVWNPPTFLDNSTISNPISTPDTTTTYLVTSTSPDGCVNEDSVTISVYYNVPIPVLPDTVNMCKGGAATINASGGNTYLWSPNSYINTITGTTVTVNPPDDQWYFCEVTNACGTVPDSVWINVIEASITAGNDTIICPGETAFIWAAGASTYQWLPSNTVVFMNGNVAEVRPNQSTNYMIIGTDVTGCKDTTYVEIVLHPAPSIQLTTDIIAFFGDEIQLEAITHSPGIFSWNPPEYLSCVNCPNPIATPNRNITYQVFFTDQNGCSTSSSVSITYDAVVYVPNTFIPDGNGINEVFKVYGGNLKEMECLIFNRWGELIHTLKSIDESWDGTFNGRICQDGTYTWKLVYKDYFGNKNEIAGHVNLIR
jgi:gliding motility-associated-like protein